MKLKFESLTKKFGQHYVLNNVSLELDGIRFLVVLGPSGGGKTTLLRMIAGLETPSSGSIIINEHTIPYQHDVPPHHTPALNTYRSKIGVVFQNYNLFPHLTAMENITLPLEKVHGFTKDAAVAKAEELLTRVQLLKHAHKKPIQLSGGQKQRIAISRAISAQPEVLLFDEPTSALDPEFTAEVLDVITELQEDIIIVTHHMGFARHVSDYILFVGEEKILGHGAPDDVFEHSTLPSIQRFFSKILRY